MNTKYQQLYPAIRDFYDRMAEDYFSDNERVFFETMKKRQQYVFTYSNDLLMSEKDNEDGIYIVRHYFDEFEIGQRESEDDAYAMNIEDAMNLNLKNAGLKDKDVTLLEWLRARDYQGIRYDGNFDEL